MEEFYTVSQAAIVLKVHTLTIRRYIKEGKLKAYRVGGNIRIMVSDLRAFIEGFTPYPKPNTNTISNKKPFSFSDPFFRLKARGISLSKGDS